MPVSRKELAQPEGFRRVARAEDDDIALSRSNKADAAQDESAHQNFRKVGVFTQHFAKSLAAQFKHVARLAHCASHEGPPFRQEIHFARELTRPVANDHALLAVFAGLRNFETAA